MLILSLSRRFLRRTGYGQPLTPSGPGISSGSLAPSGKIGLVAHASVCPNIGEPFNITANSPLQLTLDRVIDVDNFLDAGDFAIC